MCSSQFLSVDGWWVEHGYVSCQSVLQNLDPKSMALGPRTMHTHGFDFDCSRDENKGGYYISGEMF